MAESNERASSTVNPKIHSDSGYGSNKSNSQSQRSSGSSKSHQSGSSMSSGSGTGYPPHPNAPVSNADCQQHTTGSSPNTPGTSSSQAANKRQGKKKNKQGDRSNKLITSIGEKNETSFSSSNINRSSQESMKEASKNGNSAGNSQQSQSMLDQGGIMSGNNNSSNNNSNNNHCGSLPSTPQPHHAGQMSPASKASSTHDSKALQVAALTHVLSCMKKFQDPIQAYYSLLKEESEMNESNNESSDNIDGSRPNKINWEDFIAENQKEAGNEDGFATVVSLDDGVVVYITPTISNILGFPKDMLLGRSFIDFVHPKDRMAFASHITCGINFPIGDQSQCMQNLQGPTVKSEPFYCRLRQYRGLKTVGFGVTDKTMMYYPFKLTMQLKKVEIPVKHSSTTANMSNISSSSPPDMTKSDSESLKAATTTNTTSSSDGFNESASNINNASSSSSPPGLLSTVYLVICATRIKSAYQYPQEVPKNPGKFVTRHSASCHFGHMDSDAISYLGHLPQDLIGNSVLDFYHPEDLSLLKDIYASVMQEQGKPFRSKPYRFRVFNGTFAMLETDWSCFINPWSWKLEFVIGQHRVIQGPMNPNVFMQPKDEDEEPPQISDQTIMKEMILQDEIRKTLTETVSRRLSDPLRQQSSRRRKDLAALMETLLEKMAKTENSDKSGSQSSGFSVMERDSVMLGEISPHHDDNSGSNQSSSTPPSYNQLNYKENIERFFQSQPKTERSDESADQNNKMDTQNQNSSESDSKSSPNIDYSSGSNIRNSSGSNAESGNDGGRADGGGCSSPRNSLTQELLTRHNEKMERYMIQKHKESRGKSSTTPGSNRDSRYKYSDNFPQSAFRAASSKSMDDSSDFLKQQQHQQRSIGQRSKMNLQKIPLQNDGTHGLKRTGNFSWDGDSHAGHAKQPHLDGQSASNSVTASNSNTADPNSLTEFGITNSINLWPPFSISVTPGITTPSYRQTTPYPCYVFANPSSAAGQQQQQQQQAAVAAAAASAVHHQHPQHHHQHLPVVPMPQNKPHQQQPQGPLSHLPPGGVCLPGYHYIDPVTGAKTPAMLQIPHPSTPMAPPSSSSTSNNVVVSAGNAPASIQLNHPSGNTHHHHPHPYIFLQPGHHHSHSFLPQQVQLLPAGVVYQPVTSQMFGQHTPILMPLGTMIHPGQSILMATAPTAPPPPGAPPGSAHHQQPITSLASLGGIHGSSGYNLITIPTPPVSVSDSRTSGKSSNSTPSSGAGGICSLAKNTGGDLVLSKCCTSIKVTSAETPPSNSALLITSSNNGSSSCSKGSNKILVRNKSRSRFVAEADPTSSSQDVQDSRDSGDVSNSGSDDSMNASSKDDSLSPKNMEEDQSSQSWDDGENNLQEKPAAMRRNKEPTWMQNVVMSDELKFKYQVPLVDADDVLRKDMKALKIFGQQSSMVNTQLTMLYKEMDMDGCFDSSLHIEEGISSSSSGGEEQQSINGKSSGGGGPDKREPKKHKKKMCLHRFDKIALAFEEDAPFPPANLGPKCKNIRNISSSITKDNSPSSSVVSSTSKKDGNDNNGGSSNSNKAPGTNSVSGNLLLPPPPPKGSKRPSSSSSKNKPVASTPSATATTEAAA